MTDVQLKHSAATIDAQIDRVFSGAVVTENTDSEVTSDGVKPVSGAAVSKAISSHVPKVNTDWSDAQSIAIPVPQRGVVNIISESLPTTKTDDVKARLQFWDMGGNYFEKCVILNAQGTSSLYQAKKNFSVDIVGKDWDEDAPQNIKFGDWVEQDSFHFKAYATQGVRVLPLVGYDFYESILRTRGLVKDRTWKRAELPTDIPSLGNSIEQTRLQIDDGAKCHPSGFPIEVLYNGEFYGLYFWQLKKHRKNYHQQKSNANHIHLDGQIGMSSVWNAGGVIDWDKWSGKKPSDSNTDGIEIRNPKPLYLMDGSKYDGETNRGELMDETSSKYSPSNPDMVMTTKVKAALELFLQNIEAIKGITDTEDKKAKIEEVFDVDSIVDYVIFSYVVRNYDGFAKNWQWTTWDGVRWAVNAYDLDLIMCQEPYTVWTHSDFFVPHLIWVYYKDRLFTRYAFLRDNGVISTQSIASRFEYYSTIVGEELYDKEYAKWGNRNNLWRYKIWLDASIKSLDTLFGYKSSDNAMFEAIGATLNNETGLWSYNEIDDLTSNDLAMALAYANITTTPALGSGQFAYSKIRTNVNWHNRTVGVLIDNSNTFMSCERLEVLDLRTGASYPAQFSKEGYSQFYNCKKLRKILGPIDVSKTSYFAECFTGCAALEEVYLKGLKGSISFSSSPKLNKTSLLYAINNAGTAAITITLHADTLAWVSTDADVQAALANKTNVTIK